MSGKSTSATPRPLDEWLGIGYKFLNLEEMRKQCPEDDDDRKEHIAKRHREITERCNYWLWQNIELRNTRFAASAVSLSHRIGTPEEPHEKYSQPYPVGVSPPEQWLQDYFMRRLILRDYGQKQENSIPADNIRKVLDVAMDHWRKGGERAVMLKEAIDSIEQPERVKKIVCIGLGSIFMAEAEETYVMCRSLAQHTAARAIAEQLRKKTGQMIELYASDPAYEANNHKEALSTLPGVSFTILDPSYGKHEQFSMVDDSTIVISTGGYKCPTLLIVQEFARPLAMITESIGVHMWKRRDFTVPDPDVFWFERPKIIRSETQQGEGDMGMWKIPGCFSRTHPKRVMAMLENEYNLCEKFPAERYGEDRFPVKGELKYPFDLLPLDDWKLFGRGPLCTDGAYWHPLVRMHIRKT